jgi:RES domain-containing protein
MADSTMRVYRIYNDGRLPNDAMGARIAGGRWNPKGLMVLYAAAHLSLACLEKMVHLNRGTMPTKLRYAWTEVAANLGSLDPRRDYVYRGTNVTVEIGRQWIVHRKELAVRVPSVLIPEEDNILLNPIHPEYEALEWYPCHLNGIPVFLD